MSQARALEVARTWRECQLDNGVKAASIELVPGVAGSGWYTDDFVRVLGHHIVSRRSMGLTPGRRLVEVGRTGLSGPLCNVYGGFDEVARLITLGWANHPGEGGPWPVDGWGTVPRDNGRPYILGTEFEGGLSEADWTDSFHEFMARVQAGNLDFIGWLRGRGPAPLECHGEHKTWADLKQVGRKIDRLNYSTGSGRARIAAVRSGTPVKPKPEETPAVTAIAVAPDKTCWFIMDEEVRSTADIAEVEAVAKARRIPIIPMANGEIQKNIDFATRNRARRDAASAAVLAKVIPSAPPVDVDQLANELFERLAPKLQDATSLTEADIQRLLDDSEIDTVALMASKLGQSVAAGAR